MAIKKRELLRSIFKKIGSVTYEDLKSFFDSAVLVDEASSGGTGTPGADGKTVLNGAGAPSSGLGTNGDFYIDTTADAIYGPKTAGAWGSPTSLIGPTGSTGSTGSTGNGIASSSYNSGTGVLTITYTNGSTFSTGDLRGADSGTANKYFSDFTAGTITGTTANTLLRSILIPANTFGVGKLFDFNIREARSGTTAPYTIRVYNNVTNSVSGATLWVTFSAGTGVLNAQIIRDVAVISATNTEIATNASSTTAPVSVNVDWTVNQYFIVAVQPGATTETHNNKFISIHPRN